jgi:hypothetical protein
MSKWLEETHGIQFELLRHFLVRFFDSDLITAPGQATPAVIGAISIFMPWFAVMISPLKHKYAYLSSLESADVYLRAVRADQLWLITLMMSTIGLLTAIKWQSVFPGLRDYRALAALPLRSYQIFQAKLAALLIAATAAIFVLNLFPSVIFPMISGGRWALNPSFGVRVGVHTIVCAAGSYFFFFSFIALQGVLLVLLKRRLFERVSGVLQSALVPLMLVFIVLSFSIEPKVTATLLHPHFAAWLPPVWFLGLYQHMLGDRDPEMQVLAAKAVEALTVSILLSFLSYAVSYHRHRTVLIEGPSVSPTKRRRDLHLLDWLFPDPCQQAVIQFMLKTLAGSNQHRMILTAYAGSGFAVLLTAMVGLGTFIGDAKLHVTMFVYSHVVMLAFLLAGLRHVFSIPIELRANWIFRIAEAGSRREWLEAIDRLVLIVAVGVLLVPLPFEYKIVGPRAIAEIALFGTAAAVSYEVVFRSWEKLPFTCSQLPGKTPMWILVLRVYVFLSLLPLPCFILLSCLYSPVGFLIVLGPLIAIGRYLHASRREYRSEARLVYEESPEPAVQELGLLR